MLSANLSDEYWLDNWLESNRILDKAALIAALDSRTVVNDLRTRAENWNGSAPSSSSEYNLVAGSGLGEYNGLTCPNPRCKLDQLDVIYRHAWHYFDYIYIPDAAGNLLRSTEDYLDDSAIHYLSLYIETAMHLRNMGATPLTRYYAQDAVSSATLKQFDVSFGEDIWLELAQDFLHHPDRFDIEVLRSGKSTVTYNDTELQFCPMLDLNVSKVPKAQRKLILKELLSQRMATNHRHAFIHDISAAHVLKASLGSTIWTQSWIASRTKQTADESTIAFQMDFPSLSNVAFTDLISLRLENKDSFIACRLAIRKAMQELAKGGSDSNTWADQIVRDMVAPEVARLQTKLEAARKVLAKKSAIAITVAAVSTWCGIHLGLGPVASLGAGSLAAFASGLKDAASKYSEERRDLEVSDVSFLWKALKCTAK
jgi:hypothetical protein